MPPSTKSRTGKGASTGKSAATKTKRKPSTTSRPSTVQQKTKRPSSAPRPATAASRRRKAARKYSDAELGIPKLNTVVPAGVQRRGKKKNKTYVDDKESMMTILAMVNADKEGEIEGKMVRARQMEEIREARRQEAEKRQAEKQAKLEETKDSIRKRRRKRADTLEDGVGEETPVTMTKKTKRKKVSFG